MTLKSLRPPVIDTFESDVHPIIYFFNIQPKNSSYTFAHVNLQSFVEIPLLTHHTNALSMYSLLL